MVPTRIAFVRFIRSAALLKDITLLTPVPPKKEFVPIIAPCHFSSLWGVGQVIDSPVTYFLKTSKDSSSIPRGKRVGLAP